MRPVTSLRGWSTPHLTRVFPAFHGHYQGDRGFSPNDLLVTVEDEIAVKKAIERLGGRVVVAPRTDSGDPLLASMGRISGIEQVCRYVSWVFH